MKLFFIPAGLRCPTCRSPLWIEGEPSPQGKIVMQCIGRRCATKDIRFEVQLQGLEAKQIEE